LKDNSTGAEADRGAGGQPCEDEDWWGRGLLSTTYLCCVNVERDRYTTSTQSILVLTRRSMAIWSGGSVRKYCIWSLLIQSMTV